MDLSDEIAKIAREQAIANNPSPIEVKVTKVYKNNFVDVTFNNGSFNHIKANASPSVGDKGVVIFVGSKMDTPYCVNSVDYYNKAEIDEIISGGADLTQYVKKSDVDLKFKLERDGCITIGLNIGDGF